MSRPYTPVGRRMASDMIGGEAGAGGGGEGGKGRGGGGRRGGGRRKRGDDLGCVAPQCVQSLSRNSDSVRRLASDLIFLRCAVGITFHTAVLIKTTGRKQVTGVVFSPCMEKKQQHLSHVPCDHDDRNDGVTIKIIVNNCPLLYWHSSNPLQANMTDWEGY